MNLGRKIQILIVLLFVGSLAFGFTMNSVNNDHQDKAKTTETLLPESCKGVDSIETDLYPTGKECLAELKAKIMTFCGFDQKCMDDFDNRMYNQCGDDKVCTMSTLQSIYQQLGKK